ncbi:hypothetical protein JR316_0012714 [Psilocybe cubensis]|nr:hypothetical protein JR316_0012714 [Psilocybe cubensis]KAH9475597.1 hypothetical protein JR316_0012714 [Psilocybe cubensis]
MATNDEGKNYFTPAVDDDNLRAISCHIKTASPADIAFGTTNGLNDKEILPIMRYRNLGPDCTLSVKLTPILRVYAVKGYHGQDVITPDLDSNVVLSVDLTSLPQFTQWGVSFDKDSDRVIITRQTD